jgi:hypothetical protein
MTPPAFLIVALHAPLTLQGFCGYRQVLPATHHSKYRD